MKIVLTGGGTSGHVTPNIALIPHLQKAGFEVFYIGTDGIEKKLITKEGIPFYEIQAGKLRRYMDFQNVKDIGKIMKGYRQSVKILKEIRPDVVFSKGGFVSCPVVWAAKRLGIPVVIHESDITPGLANKLSAPCADRICYAFPETKQHLAQDKSIYTGLPVRESLLKGDRQKGLELCGFSGEKTVLTVIGGSQGSAFLNDLIRANMLDLKEVFDIIHICGKGNISERYLDEEYYKQFEYADEELADLMAATDLFVSRAGATAIFEIVALKKPMLLIPLSLNASRGDQILNAKSFKERGFAIYCEEEDMSNPKFINLVLKTFFETEKMVEAQKNSGISKGNSAVVNVILDAVKKGKR